MSNVQSYNALIDRFKAFASGHFILKSFSHGQIDTADLEKFTEYPFMHVVPSNVTYAKGTKTFSFQIVLADLPRDKDDKVEFQREVLSDLQRIAEDLVAEITNHRVLFGDLITVQNVSLEPFLEEFHNTLTGWTVSLELLVPYYWDACSIPAEWNDMFESGSGGTGSILTFIDSITRDENGNVSLVNDEAEPAPNYYYGTNDEGVRGWYLLTDEVGLTCATIGTCQTIIDIESAIDDLQTEILLKANTADLGAVAFSNDYNDLDNLPNLSGYGDMFKSVYDTDVDGVVDSAERIQIVVRNSTGSTLTKGQIVYLSGATGNRPNAVLAQANAELTSSKTIGMVIADIVNNADGQVAVNGTLHDLDTSAFTAGDTLWLSATTAGGMVANTPPSEPNHAVFIGYVARSHPNLGRVVLAIQNGYELDELHGVQITTPANNEVLTYESSTSLWKNKTVATALGYTPVPTTRSITINGTTQDLSADRTFSVGTFNLPSLTSGSVLFSNGTTIAQDNTNLFWDDTNNRLGIGTASPSAIIHSVGSVTAATAIARGNYLQPTLVASANNDVLVGLDIQPTFTTGAFTGVQSVALRLPNGGRITNATTNGGYNVYIANSETTLNSPSSTGTIGFQLNYGFVGRFMGTTGNFILQNGGTFTDAGYRLDVNGSVRTTGSISAASAIARGTYLNQTLVATANNDVLVGLEINPTFTNGAFTGVKNNWINLIGNASINFTNQLYLKRGDVDVLFASSAETQLKTISSTAPLKFFVGSTSQFGQFFATTGNFTLQNGGTFTDAGFRLDVQGTSRFTGAATFNNNMAIGGTLAVGTFTTAVASAQLEVVSTTKGFLPPRMTTTQKNAIASPAAGLVVYDTTLNKLCVRTASSWETITSI